MSSPPVHIHYFICLTTHQQLQEWAFDGGHAAKLILFDVPGILEVELMCCFNNSSIDKVVLYPNNPSTPFTEAAACPQFYTQYEPPPPYQAIASVPPREIPPCDLGRQQAGVEIISSDEDE